MESNVLPLQVMDRHFEVQGNILTNFLLDVSDCFTTILTVLLFSLLA
jgi:hypothetical protein